MEEFSLETEWIKLRREAEQPRSSIGKCSPAACYISSCGTAFHAGPADSARRFCCSKIGRKFLREVLLFHQVMHKAESERERGHRGRPLLEQRISDIRRWVCDDVLAALSQHLPRLQSLWSGYIIVRSARRACSMLCFLSSSDETSPAEGEAETKKDPAELNMSRSFGGMTRERHGGWALSSQSFLLGEMTAWSGRWAR